MKQEDKMLEKIKAFLPCVTPDQWIEYALRSEHEATLLVDHANCEKKAASTALSLIHRYASYPVLVDKMSQLAREELRHFEQVLKLMRKRGISYGILSAARYAKGLYRAVRRNEPGRLVDTLIIGALIEARSCERFACLVPELDSELSDFYASLLKSEGRHFEDYLKLVESMCAANEVSMRLDVFRALEADLVLEPDTDFRFHSGPPA